jgi:hypothetical protein
MKKQPTITIPPEYITFQNRDFWLDRRIQTTPLGKEVRYSSIRVNEEMPNRYGKQHYIYTFVYLDGSGVLEFECDYNDKINVRKKYTNED